MIAFVQFMTESDWITCLWTLGAVAVVIWLLPMAKGKNDD